MIRTIVIVGAAAAVLTGCGSKAPRLPDADYNTVCYMYQIAGGYGLNDIADGAALDWLIRERHLTREDAVAEIDIARREYCPRA